MPELVDPDIRACVDRVARANARMRKDPTDDHREAVCVETRSLFATFEDVSCWAGVVNETARDLVMRALGESAELLRVAPAESEAYRMYAAVVKRHEAVKTFQVRDAAADIPAKSI